MVRNQQSLSLPACSANGALSILKAGNHEILLRNAVMSSLRALATTGSIMLLSIISSGIVRSQDAAEEARRIVREHEANIQPLEIENARAWWKANVSGKDEDFAAKEQAENRLND